MAAQAFVADAGDMTIAAKMRPKAANAVTAAIGDLDWPRILDDLGAQGHATTGRLLDAETCDTIAALYEPNDTKSGGHLFRSHVVMARHGFGSGEYKYFADPLPPVVEALRQSVYPYLAPLANRWSAALRLGVNYPDALDAFRAQCAALGQTKPTPLLLRYREGDYNCLHQDLYGDLFFPIQLAVLLSRPGEDFTGGEFVLTEQRPRMQSRAEVVSLGQGEGVLFAVNHRPKQGARGIYRVTMRHGVSRVRSGSRHTLGIIFHDAR